MAEAARTPEACAAPDVCIACDAAPTRGVRLRNGHDLLRCPQCGLGWWRWPSFDPASFYDRDYFQSVQAEKGYQDYGSLEPGMRRTARTRLRRIERLLGGKAPYRLFELGCGTGVFLDEARRRGWDVAGVEVSDYAAAVARGRGLDVRGGGAERAELEPGAYDCVAMWDVIEHLQRPLAALAAAAKGLRPGGLLALSTGDVSSLCARVSGARWHLYNLPEHLFFFTPRALRRLLARASFETERVVREVNWVPLSYVAERLGLAGLSARLGRWAGCADWVLPATLLDVVGVYARRRERRAGHCDD